MTRGVSENPFEWTSRPYRTIFPERLVMATACLFITELELWLELMSEATRWRYLLGGRVPKLEVEEP